MNIVKVLRFSVSTDLPRFLSKGPLKHDFSDIYLPMFFEAGISGNTSAMMVNFLWQRFKCEYRFKKCKKKKKKIQKKFFVFQTIASELVALNSPY